MFLNGYVMKRLQMKIRKLQSVLPQEMNCKVLLPLISILYIKKVLNTLTLVLKKHSLKMKHIF